MNTSSRFIVATHILVSMAGRRILAGEDRALKSDMLAVSVNTNPVVIRRIIGLLKKAGLVQSQSGPKGGTVLSKAPENITLEQIYEAVDNGELFHMHYGGPNTECSVGKNIQVSLIEILDQAKNAMTKTLATKTVRDIAEDIMERSGIKEMMASGMSVLEIEKMIDDQYLEMIKNSTCKKE
jgi:Rrf2 family protein